MIFQRALGQPDVTITESFPWHSRALKRIEVFGLKLLSATPQETIDILVSTDRCRAAFVNAHCVNVADRDPEYRKALTSASLLLPDGIGVDLAARRRGQRFEANLNGTDLCPMLLENAAKRQLSVFLLGGHPGVAEQAAAKLTAQIKDLRIVGTRDGYAGAKGIATIKAVNDSQADILLVAMGVPLQDVWLWRNHALLRPRLVLGVGAFLDFASGRVPRAPLLVRQARLEWLWRFGLEPRRLFGRYVTGNAEFLWRLARNRHTLSDLR
jgi:exopolysaccharide biosynthesis WecB/TagA/CpsF family protein